MPADGRLTPARRLELPIFVAWLALGALMTSVLAKAPAHERDLPETGDRAPHSQ